MKDLQDLKSRISRSKKTLMRKYGLKEIGIFGSYVGGKQRRKSDVDILVDFDDGMTLLRFVEMENYLSELLGVKVDLVMKSALKPRIGKRILDEVVYI